MFQWPEPKSSFQCSEDDICWVCNKMPSTNDALNFRTLLPQKIRFQSEAKKKKKKKKKKRYVVIDEDISDVGELITHVVNFCSSLNSLSKW